MEDDDLDNYMHYEDDAPLLRPIDEALIDAARVGDVKAVKNLIAEGANVCMNDPFHASWALDFAADRGHIEVVRTLLEHGANVNADDDSALRACASNGNLEMVQLLVENGADVHAGNGDILIAAADCWNLKLVEYLVERGVRVNAQFDAPVEVAARAGCQEITQYLIVKGASAEAAYSAGGEKIQPAIDAANRVIRLEDMYEKLSEELPRTKAQQLLVDCASETPPAKKTLTARLKL